VSQQKPLDPPMTPYAVAGIIAFALAGIVMWIAGAPSSWVWICVAGFLWGFVGLYAMLRHDRGRAPQ
jgi:hypothetical protein